MRYTKDIIEKAVKDCYTWAEVCRKIGIKPFTGAQTNLTKRAKEFGVDTSHFKGKAHSKGKKLGKKPLEYYYAGAYIQSSRLRERLIEEGVFKDECCECGITEWLGEKPPLELDHINSDHEDNRLENLQILCANCHAIETRKRKVVPAGVAEWQTRTA